MHGSEKWRLWELSKRNKLTMVQCAQYCFWALQDCLKHLENVRALDCVSCSKIVLRAGNNPVVLKNSTEQADPLFIALIEHGITPFCFQTAQKNSASLRSARHFENSMTSYCLGAL